MKYIGYLTIILSRLLCLHKKPFGYVYVATKFSTLKPNIEKMYSKILFVLSPTFSGDRYPGNRALKTRL